LDQVGTEFKEEQCEKCLRTKEERINWGKYRETWKDYPGKKKIMHALLWIVYKAVVKRFKMLGRNNIRELKENVEYREKFSNRWRIIMQAVKETKYNWNKFIEAKGNFLLCSWETQNYIKGERMIEGVENIMAKSFNRHEETWKGTTCFIRSERRKKLETLANLEILFNEIKEIWRMGIPKDDDTVIRGKKWQKMLELRFEEKNPVELENYTESITVNGELTILEDEYIQKTIWRKRIPTQEKPVLVTTVIEKLANEEMKIMYDFLKKHLQGRIYRKPVDIEYFWKTYKFTL
jgi:predicted Fe-S protein YdhL (DUF1289 family)